MELNTQNDLIAYHRQISDTHQLQKTIDVSDIDDDILTSINRNFINIIKANNLDDKLWQAVVKLVTNRQAKKANSIDFELDIDHFATDLIRYHGYYRIKLQVIAWYHTVRNSGYDNTETISKQKLSFADLMPWQIYALFKPLAKYDAICLTHTALSANRRGMLRKRPDMIKKYASLSGNITGQRNINYAWQLSDDWEMLLNYLHFFEPLTRAFIRKYQFTQQSERDIYHGYFHIDFTSTPNK